MRDITELVLSSQSDSRYPNASTYLPDTYFHAENIDDLTDNYGKLSETQQPIFPDILSRCLSYFDSHRHGILTGRPDETADITAYVNGSSRGGFARNYNYVHLLDVGFSNFEKVEGNELVGTFEGFTCDVHDHTGSINAVALYKGRHAKMDESDIRKIMSSPTKQSFKIWGNCLSSNYKVKRNGHLRKRGQRVFITSVERTRGVEHTNESHPVLTPERQQRQTLVT